MHKITLKIIGSVVLLFSTHLIAATAVKNNSNYVAMQHLTLSVDGLKTSNILFRLGKYIDSNDFAIEARADFGISQEENTTNNIKRSYKTNLLAGAYLTKYINIDTSGASRLYGLLGYTVLNYSYTKNNKNINATDSSATVGIGVDFRVTNHSNLVLEYAEYNKYISNLNSKLDGLSIRLSVNF